MFLDYSQKISFGTGAFDIIIDKPIRMVFFQVPPGDERVSEFGVRSFGRARRLIR